ncbi:MAG: YwiC-like family protein [Chloroflexota bacterium]|nr:YwiC-like family protein [Chloroflexota bacterium]
MPSPRKPTLRSVAMPAEHGGWGLTLEPGILGVLVAPSVAGLLLGVAALLAFLVRTPLRLVLIGRHRAGDRSRSVVSLERMRLATRIAGLELAGIGGAVVATALLASDPMWWLPMAVAVPLFAVALWFDMRSLSRHLVPEIVGSVAIAGVAAMGALAGGATWPLAIGAWVILGARILSSIPHVRAQVLRLHRQEVPAALTLVGDLTALGTAIVAVLLEPTLILGALAVVGLIVIQRITLARPPRPARILGVRQMILGFTVVGATAAGVWLL